MNFKTSENEKAAVITPHGDTAEKNFAIVLLNRINKQAQDTLNTQVSHTGWIGKTTDLAADVLGSKYCKKDLSELLIQNRADIDTLEQANEDGNFNSKFFDIFGVNYNAENIKNFEKIFDKQAKIQAAKGVLNNTNKKLGGYVKFFEENSDLEQIERNLKIKNDVPNIDKKLDEFGKALISVTGDKNILKELNKKNKDFGKSEREQRISTYTELARELISRDKKALEDLKEGKSSIELKKEFNESYKKAFGSKNNVNRKVMEYSVLQKARAYFFKLYSLRYGLKAVALATGPLSIPAKAMIRSSMKFGMDTANVVTKKEDNKLTKNTVTKLAKNAVFSGISYATKLKLYKEIPKIHSNNKYIEYGFNEIRKLLIRLTTDKVTNEIKSKV
ncbi:MAG: hypothetical protein ACI37T_07920 [Candidatus Gastranaerophilaceae bacterium]